MLGKLACRLSGHAVDRQRVWHDGLSFRTRCESCNAPLIRDRGGWRKFDFEKDPSKHRSGHPVTGEMV